MPDLYKGKIGVDKEEVRGQSADPPQLRRCSRAFAAVDAPAPPLVAQASHLYGALDWQNAVAEIKKVAAAAAAAGAPRVGISGFCMGGALSLAGAQHSEHIVAGARIALLL